MINKGIRVIIERTDLLIVDCWASQHRLYVTYDEVEGLVAKKVVKKVDAADKH